jgi:HK97 gp10 family phage protein
MAIKGGFDVKVTGLDGIRLAMAAGADPKKIDKAITTAAKAAAKPIAAEAKRRAPKRTGRLRKAIKTQGVKYEKPGALVTISPGKRRDDLSGAWYRWFIVSGVPRLGIAPRPFIDQAETAKRGEALEIFREKIDDLITNKLTPTRTRK